MEEVVVTICTITAIVLVYLGFRNRRKISEQEQASKSNNNTIETDNLDMSNIPRLFDKERFRTKLSKAGFKDETIDDMREKILDKKGYVSDSDAIAIIDALGPIMTIRKDDT